MSNRNTNYVLQTVDGNGNTRTYAITNDSYWTNPSSGDINTRNYDGGSNNSGNKPEHYGIEFEKSAKIFNGITDENSDNAYGKAGKNNADAVYALCAPVGYTKEPKYAYKYQSSHADFVYAVFKKNSAFTNRSPEYFINRMTTQNNPYVIDVDNNDLYKSSNIKSSYYNNIIEKKYENFINY